MKTLRIGSAMLLACAVACSPGVDVDEVPVGTEVEVTKDDGGVVKGKLAERTEEDVVLNVGRTTRPVPRADIADVRVVDGAKPAELPRSARFREYTLAAGTPLKVKLDAAVGSATSNAGDPVTATLSTPVVVDGVEVLPAGSTVRGQVRSAEAAGKVKGRASLSLHFSTVAVANRDETTPIDADVSFVSESSKSDDAKKIAIPAAGGAAVGAILGGKKGAAIGGAIGGGAGTAVVLSTSGEEVTLGQGSGLTLTLDEDVIVRVPIER
jgi:type IV secretion system protein VirB10